MASFKEPSVQAEENQIIIIQGRCEAKGCEWCGISEKGMNRRWKRDSQETPDRGMFWKAKWSFLRRWKSADVALRALTGSRS